MDPVAASRAVCIAVKPVACDVVNPVAYGQAVNALWQSGERERGDGARIASRERDDIIIGRTQQSIKADTTQFIVIRVTAA